MSSQDETSTDAPKEPQENKAVLERLQQYLKEKIPTEAPEPSGIDLYDGPVDLNQNAIISDEDRAGFDVLKEILDYKKSILLQQPEIIELLKSIAESRK